MCVKVGAAPSPVKRGPDLIPVPVPPEVGANIPTKNYDFRLARAIADCWTCAAVARRPSQPARCDQPIQLDASNLLPSFRSEAVPPVRFRERPGLIFGCFRSVLIPHGHANTLYRRIHDERSMPILDKLFRCTASNSRYCCYFRSPCTCFSRSSNGSTCPFVQRSGRVSIGSS
jgi:hypothetical protein